MGSGPRSAAGAGAGAVSGSLTRTVARGTLFDHEKLEVYRVAREFVVLASALIQRKMPLEVRNQFDGAALSILSNIGEGAGKTARADKRRYYEIARGSTTEAATQLDVLRIRGLVTEEQYAEARTLLLRIAQMLSRLVSSPRIA